MFHGILDLDLDIGYIEGMEEKNLPLEPVELPKPQPELPKESKELPAGDTAEADTPVVDDIKTLLSWHAPGRPFKKRSKEFFTNMLLIMLAVEIILFLFSMYSLMLLVIALVFVTFALELVPPHPYFYKISTEGIRIQDYYFIWEELYDFYFTKQHGETTLHIGTKAFYPGEILLTLGEVTPQQVKEVLLPYLPYREYVKPTFVEKAGGWLEHNFPLEKPTN